MSLEEITALDTSSYWSSWCHWVPTSMAALREAEQQILSYLKVPFRGWFANIGKSVGPHESLVRTICVNEDSTNTPLVMVHGFGAGVGLWLLNLEHLASKRPVYAFDILGFGRSSRPHFSTHSEEAEAQLVESIEEWRKSVGLDKFVLVGHSMGGFLAASYALTHPQRVQHLILADPWGFQERKPDAEKRFPIWAKVIITLIQPFNPLAVLRAAGPWGPGLVNRLRPDLKAKFSTMVNEDQDFISNYIYHCNAQTPSGETAFKTMTSRVGWARHPMAKRILEMNSGVPISFIYGAESWVDRSSGQDIKGQLKESAVDIHVIHGAGHHVYADQPEAFNRLVQQICNKVDRKPTPSHQTLLAASA